MRAISVLALIAPYKLRVRRSKALIASRGVSSDSSNMSTHNYRQLGPESFLKESPYSVISPGFPKVLFHTFRSSKRRAVGQCATGRQLFYVCVAGLRSGDEVVAQKGMSYVCRLQLQ